MNSNIQTLGQQLQIGFEKQVVLGIPSAQLGFKIP
jgi:hypothetical protein